jgi:cytosine/adenosine deaminase-related metal-dependent hydrolase
VLQLLTSGNAELAGLSGPRNPYPSKLGRIEAGAYADILVVDGNQLGDISVIADPNPTMKLIMKDARIHKNALQGKTVSSVSRAARPFAAPRLQLSASPRDHERSPHLRISELSSRPAHRAAP